MSAIGLLKTNEFQQELKQKQQHSVKYRLSQMNWLANSPSLTDVFTTLEPGEALVAGSFRAMVPIPPGFRLLTAGKVSALERN
jgi:hypothetical protein